MKLSISSHFAGTRVQERHRTLSRAIGYFQEEQDAYEMVSRLMWALPLTITCAALLDMAMMVIYMKCIHPWRKLCDVNASVSDCYTKL